MDRFLQTAKRQGSLPASRPVNRRRQRKPTAENGEKGYNQYVDRQRHLTLLGFSTYDEYLASPVWVEIRCRILAKEPNCQLCRQVEAYTAHHTSYALAVLAGQDDSGLVSACRGCHKSIEFREGQKLLGATAVHTRLAKRARFKLSKKQAKKLAQSSYRRCRCCRQQRRGLGREDICLQCFRTHGPAVHVKAAANEQRIIAAFKAAQAERQSTAILELRP